MRAWLAILGLIAPLAACKQEYSPNTYASSAVQQANKVERGVIIGVRGVDVSAAGVVGAASGAAAGGVAGSQTPGGTVGSAFGAVGGALLGGLVGAGVEKAAADTKAWEYIVRKPNGDLVSVTQTDAAPLPLGQKVLVIAGSQARIVADYTKDAPQDAAATPAAVAAGASHPDASPAVAPPVAEAPLLPPSGTLPNTTNVPQAASATAAAVVSSSGAAPSPSALTALPELALPQLSPPSPPKSP